MARTQLAHFEHHRQEIKLTQNRFRLAVLLLFVSLSVVVGLQFRGSEAATVTTPEIASGESGQCLADAGDSTVNDTAAVLEPCSGAAAQQWVLSGKLVKINGKCLDVYQAKTANGTKVELFTCNAGANQNWAFTSGRLVNANSGTCLDAFPVGTADGTQLQIYTCNANIQQKWAVSSYSITTTPVPTPTPNPTPVPTPVPTPKPTPVPTPKPTAKPTSTPAPTPNPGSPGDGGSGGSSGSSGGNSSGSGDPTTSTGSSGSSDGSTATTPDAPGGFAALASGSNAVIDLTWTASSDAAGIASYQLERSIDETNWVVLSSVIANTAYNDASVDFGIHYYYRIKAIDTAGVDSVYSYADAETPTFSINAGSDNSSSYASNNQLAQVVLPTGAVESDADCSVAAGTTPILPTSQQKLVAGAFSLVCKDSQGDLISSFAKPLAWTFYLKGKLGGLDSPAAYTEDDTGKTSLIQNAKFTPSNSTMVFTTATGDAVLVLADVAPSVSWSFVLTMLILIGAVAGVLVLILRKKQKNNYDEYLRSKYYNL